MVEILLTIYMKKENNGRRKGIAKGPEKGAKTKT